MSAAAIDLDAVLTDGAVVKIRTTIPSDADELERLHERACDRSIYLRFFTIGRGIVRRHLEQLSRPASADQYSLVAETSGRPVAVAEFERIDDTDAEMALLVDDARRHSGIGTLLAEHLAAVARGYGYRRFVAEVLTENVDVLQMLNGLGLSIGCTNEGPTTKLTIDLEMSPAAIYASDEREAFADIASLQAILKPKSVAVVGAGRNPSGVGNRVLRSIVDGGFPGPVFAINPRGESVFDVPAVTAATKLPVAVDLAVIAVPSEQVPSVVRACGERGIRGLVVVSSGFGEAGAAGADRQREILALARRFSMRLIGPNCIGILNTDPLVRLNATFGDLPMTSGALGLASQSGALGVAVVEEASRCGPGIAEFVSLGNKADVSGNDLLMTWEHEPRVGVIALYLESFGNPRKFARIARRISRVKPIIAIKGGRSAAGGRAGLSHTAAATSAPAVVDAMFEQAGVIRVDTIVELLDAARVLASQPIPRGIRLAIAGNSGGPQILAADAASGCGLDVVRLSDGTQRALQDAAPKAVCHNNPIDLGAAADAACVGRTVAALLASDDVDMVLTVFTKTAVGDSENVLAEIARAAKGAAKPVVATQIGGGISPSSAAGQDHGVPVFTFPEPAARSLGIAAAYGRIREMPTLATTPIAGVDRPAAHAIVSSALASDARWLSPEQAASLLAGYGVQVCAQQVATTVDAALSAARQLGYPVAVKAADGGLHKTELHAVSTRITDEDALRRAIAEIWESVPGCRLLVQKMAPTGAELIVGAAQDARFGPIVMVGAGGTLTDLLDDRRLALAPIDPFTAAGLLEQLRIAPVLHGYRGSPAVSMDALADLIARISQLAYDVPQIAELDLNPVICHADTISLVDVRIRVAPEAALPDPVLRKLATP